MFRLADPVSDLKYLSTLLDDDSISLKAFITASIIGESVLIDKCRLSENYRKVFYEFLEKHEPKSTINLHAANNFFYETVTTTLKDQKLYSLGILLLSSRDKKRLLPLPHQNTFIEKIIENLNVLTCHFSSSHWTYDSVKEEFCLKSKNTEEIQLLYWTCKGICEDNWISEYKKFRIEREDKNTIKISLNLAANFICQHTKKDESITPLEKPSKEWFSAVPSTKFYMAAENCLAVNEEEIRNSELFETAILHFAVQSGKCPSIPANLCVNHRAHFSPEERVTITYDAGTLTIPQAMELYNFYRQAFPKSDASVVWGKSQQDIIISFQSEAIINVILPAIAKNPSLLSKVKSLADRNKNSNANAVASLSQFILNVGNNAPTNDGDTLTPPKIPTMR